MGTTRGFKWPEQPELGIGPIGFFIGAIIDIVIIMTIFFVICATSGCAVFAPMGGKPRFYSTAEYEGKQAEYEYDEKGKKGKIKKPAGGIDFSGSATADDVAKMLNQKEDLRQKEEIWNLTKEKLKSQPALTKTENGAPKGLKGIVANFANYRVNIVLRHITVKSATASYVLEAGARTEDYLIIGDYEMTTYVGGEADGHNKFSVGAPQYSFLGEKVHWYAYYDPRALRQKRYDRW